MGVSVYSNQLHPYTLSFITETRQFLFLHNYKEQALLLQILMENNALDLIAFQALVILTIYVYPSADGG
jgi:hypothetical protein